MGTFNYDFAWRRTINFSGTYIRASEDEPVLVQGFQYSIADGGLQVWFIITNVIDLRSLPGYAKGTIPTDDAQAPFHEGGAGDFKLDRNDCG